MNIAYKDVVIFENSLGRYSDEFYKKILKIITEKISKSLAQRIETEFQEQEKN